jgi:hypothetical protein
MTPGRRWGWGLLALAGLAALGYGLMVVAFPRLLMPGEGALTYSAWLLAHGRNPYALLEHPQSVNVYGIAAPLLQAGLSFLGWPLTVQGLRALNLLGLLAGLACLGAGLRRLGLDRLRAGVLLLPAGFAQMAFVGLHARVDGLSAGLLAAGLWLPWRRGFDNRGLLQGA